MIGRKSESLLKSKVGQLASAGQLTGPLAAPGQLAATQTIVKRSKTFSPSAPISKSQYNHRVRIKDNNTMIITDKIFKLGLQW